MSRWGSRALGRWMMVIGVLLLAVDVAGMLVPVPKEEGPVADDGSMVAGYHFATQGGGELLRLLKEGAAGADIRDLNRLVFHAVAHGDPPPVRFLDCWPRWLVGAVLPDLRLNQSARRLVRGRRGLCSDAVIILNAVAEQSGYEARMVDLVGHVVSEIQGPEGWRVADPDFGVVYDVGVDQLEGAGGEAIIREALAGAGQPSSTINSYVRAACTPEDNRVVPAGVLNPRLYRIEIVADWVAWLFPVLLVLVGWTWGRSALGR